MENCTAMLNCLNPLPDGDSSCSNMGHLTFLNEIYVKIKLIIEVRMFQFGIMPLDVYIDNDNGVFHGLN